jgi:multiple antibiotic resistance protein
VNYYDHLFAHFVLLWAVIDPIGTIPVFISVTRGRAEPEVRDIAKKACLVAGGILIFFIVAGEIVLKAMGVDLLVFQIAGGIVLFLFALTMIFGDSKPEEEIHLAKSAMDSAIFPLATPSLASPGAMMAVVLITENASHTIAEQAITTGAMLVVVLVAYVFMRFSSSIISLIGDGGASIVSRVMGLILASIAATNVLLGLKEFFQ